MQSRRPWRIVAAALFIALAAFAAQQRITRLISTLDSESRARLAAAADARYPGYPQFLERVRAATRPGDRIAIVFPASSWDRGYAYGYYRASYILAGREVLPLMTTSNSPLPSNFASANFVAAFRRRIPRGDYRVVFSTADGLLVRR